MGQLSVNKIKCWRIMHRCEDLRRNYVNERRNWKEWKTKTGFFIFIGEKGELEN